MAEILRAYSRYSYDLPALQRVLATARTSPLRDRSRAIRQTKRKLAVAIGPDQVRSMVDDCQRGMSQNAVARKYGVSQSSISKYVLQRRRE